MLSLVWLILSNAGVVLWPMLALSVAALAVAIERVWRLRSLRHVFATTRTACVEALLKGGGERALAVIDSANAAGRVLLAGLTVREQGPEVVRAVALDAAQREVPALERGLGVLLATTQVAPLLGLLGTVVGLIEAFRTAHTGDAVTTKALAGGIYHALAATAAGLAVAIPAFVAYSVLTGWVGRLSDQLEHAATDLAAMLWRRQ